MKKTNLFAGLVAGLFLTSVAGFAQTTITSLPYTITAPGNYLLGGNLGAAANSGAAITIATSYVTLDLDGFYLFGGGPNSIGIAVTDQVDITIKNGGLVGFNTAVLLQGSPNYGHHVQDLNISGCANGISLGTGNQSIVERNQISNGTGIGIYAQGFGDRIKNNDISSFRIGIRSFGGNYIQANFLTFCPTALWLGGNDRRRDNITIFSANGHRGGSPKDSGQDD
jgi:Periplasmic copper-binding protein (NosD)